MFQKEYREAIGKAGGAQTLVYLIARLTFFNVETEKFNELTFRSYSDFGPMRTHLHSDLHEDPAHIQIH